MKRNEEIRNEVKRNRLYMYELASAAGVSQSALMCWMRTPLDDAHYKRLKDAIEKLKAGVCNE